MRCYLVVFAVGLLGIAPSVQAGTICGVVRDASTLAPIPRAGVFVRMPGGAYTGYHAATDSTGSYCVENVPAGTYDLEIRVDNYQTTYVRDVVVGEDVIGVDLDALPVPLLRAWPNPARGRVTIELAAPDYNATLEVFDIRGRFVRGWRLAGSEARGFTWDLRDAYRAALPAGVYFLRLRSPKSVAQARLTIMR